MSIFSDNIRVLRNKKNLSQQSFAESLGMSRVRYSKYEDGRSEPPYEILINISKYFHVSIDLLLTVDIRKYPIDDVLKLPDNRIVLPIVVDQQGNNYVEIVPQKASMGYLNGYSDPEYIESLPRMSLPFLGPTKHRGFTADGDSMPPFIDGTCAVCEYVEKIDYLKPGKEYMFITVNGYTFKTFVELNETTLRVAADNSFYKPYDIPLEDILEVWKYKQGILPEDYKLNSFVETNGLKEIMLDMKKEIQLLKEKVSYKINQ
jgi:transcriptional regulator with XRE-family HTH domain